MAFKADETQPVKKLSAGSGPLFGSGFWTSDRIADVLDEIYPPNNEPRMPLSEREKRIIEELNKRSVE